MLSRYQFYRRTGLFVPDIANASLQRSFITHENHISRVQKGHSDLLMEKSKKLSAMQVKPPNILVQTDNKLRFDDWKTYLQSILGEDQYTVYKLPTSKIFSDPWPENCSLLVLENNFEDLQDVTERYLSSGGKILSFLPSQGTATDHTNKEIKYKENGMNRSFTTAALSDVKAGLDRLSEKFSKVSLKNLDDKESAKARKDVIIAEETACGTNVVWGRLANRGNIVFSSLDLIALFKDKDKELRNHSLSLGFSVFSYLNLICKSSAGSPVSYQCQASAVTPAYLIGNIKDQEAFMKCFKDVLKDNVVQGQAFNIEFVSEKKSEKVSAFSNYFPIHINESCSAFDSQDFYANLKTSWLGRSLIYSEVVESTQDIFEKNSSFNRNSPNGLVITAKQQTKGHGRGGNVWLSPIGCMMYSAKLEIPVSSNLGQRLPFLQHIAAVAFAKGVRNQEGYEDVPIKVKWPNDIYYNSSAKLGGVIVKSTILKDEFHTAVGMGVNVSNEKPTLCTNRVIEEFNGENGTKLALLSVEALLGRTLTEFEKLITLFQNDGPEAFCREYYKYWMHSGQKVQLESEQGEEVTICGLDEYGYLEVLQADGIRVVLHPDGNTFDIMKNLIRSK